MHFNTSTLIALLSAASLTMAAPAPATASHNAPAINTPAAPTVDAATAANPTIQARIQFEVERQTTFIQRQFPVGAGPIPINLATAFSAFIVNVEDIISGEDVNVSVVCQGLDAQGRAVGAPIDQDSANADLNGGDAVAIAAVECVLA